MPLKQPLPAYRFRVAGCKPEITENVESAHLDMAGMKVTIKLRATVLGSDFVEAINFGRRANFHLEAMSGGDGICFSIHPMVMKLIAHDVPFTYKGNEVLFHTFVFSFQDIDARYVVPDFEEPTREPPKDPYFMSMEEAIETLQNLDKKIDPKTGKQILTEEAPVSNTIIIDDPIYRDSGC